MPDWTWENSKPSRVENRTEPPDNIRALSDRDLFRNVIDHCILFLYQYGTLTHNFYVISWEDGNIFLLSIYPCLNNSSMVLWLWFIKCDLTVAVNPKHAMPNSGTQRVKSTRRIFPFCIIGKRCEQYFNAAASRLINCWHKKALWKTYFQRHD